MGLIIITLLAFKNVTTWYGLVAMQDRVRNGVDTSNSHNDCNNRGQPKTDTCRQGGMGGQNVLKMCRHPL